MRFFNRETREELTYDTERAMMLAVYSPISNFFVNHSNRVDALLSKYKNVPLTPYVMTEKDKEKLANNPDYINDIPRFVVKGYDRRVSNSRFDSVLSKEFCTRCEENDLELMLFINMYHPLIVATTTEDLPVQE